MGREMGTGRTETVHERRAMRDLVTAAMRVWSSIVLRSARRPSARHGRPVPPKWVHGLVGLPDRHELPPPVTCRHRQVHAMRPLLPVICRSTLITWPGPLMPCRRDQVRTRASMHLVQMGYIRRYRDWSIANRPKATNPSATAASRYLPNGCARIACSAPSSPCAFCRSKVSAA